jgi:hypothetical protein
LLGVFPMGERVVLPGGHWVRVHSYAAPVTPSNPYSQPRAGATFAVIDVEGCVGPSAPPSGLLNPFFFQLAMPDGTALQAGIPVKDPPLIFSTLAPGECDRGLVTFEVADQAKPVTVAYGIPAGSVRWTLPN